MYFSFLLRLGNNLPSVLGCKDRDNLWNNEEVGCFFIMRKNEMRDFNNPLCTPTPACPRYGYANCAYLQMNEYAAFVLFLLLIK